MQLTKYQHHHGSGDVEEEHTFIVDLSSRTQRAQRWRHRRLIGKERAADAVPELRFFRFLLSRKNQVHFSGASKQETPDQSETDLFHANSGFMFCACGFSTFELHSVWRKSWVFLLLLFFLWVFSACFTAQVQTVRGLYFNFSSPE